MPVIKKVLNLDFNGFPYFSLIYHDLSNRFFVLDEADGLLKANYGELIERLHRQMPKITSDGKRLQMVVCSATLHAFEVKKMAVSSTNFTLLNFGSIFCSNKCNYRKN